MLQIQNGAATGLPAGVFDFVLISAVLHHVPLSQRSGVYAELHRVLRPGGNLVVFEHNPWNPVTRYVVTHTPIDREAILLPPAEVVAALSSAGWHNIRSSHLMFLPPRAGPLATAVERVFRWLPLGGQYAVTACK
jgi:SAM-dependent methyltransferase